MDLSTLPASAFIDPTGKNRRAIETLLQQVTEQILDHLTQAASHTPLPEFQTLPAIAPPDAPTEVNVLLEQLDVVLKTAMNPAHPRYIGHMDPLPTTFSIVGDWVAAALNNNMLSVEMSPFFSRLEPILMQEIAQLFGLGDQAGGVLVSGGSLANLQALAVARNVKLDTLKEGLAGRQKTPVFFVSEVAHTSIKKAAMMLGLGVAGAISVPVNAQSQIDVASLRTVIDQAYQVGQQPFALVATAGTTVTGNIDPLDEMVAIAQTHNLWFHVDAAYGGALAFAERYRDRLQGIEQADSVTFNPQKWLYVTKTCASVLFRNLSTLHRHFQLTAPYMNMEQDWVNLGEMTVQGTRHADVLKLWLSLQHLGKQGYSALIEASYALTEQFTEAVQRRSYLKLVSEPEMNVVCFRGCPSWVPSADWNHWNAELQAYLLKQGNAFVSLPRYRGQNCLKVVLLNPFMTTADIQRVFEVMDEFAKLGARR